jgi:hypothetical protein
MNDRLSEVSRRVHGYWYIDGLAEIGCGILLTLIGIPYLLWSLASPASRLARFASNSKVYILLFGLILLFFVVKLIKQKSTYPRSGYIKERPPERKWILKLVILILALTLLFPLLIGGFRLFPNFRLVFLNSMYYYPGIIGFIITSGLLVSGSRTGIYRFYTLAGVAALLSMGLMWVSFQALIQHPFELSFFPSLDFNAQLPPEAATVFLALFRVATQELGIFFAFFGLAMLISGLIGRYKYLSTNPLSTEAANGQ